MLPVNELGSDSPLYFSLLEHPCTDDLTRITGPVVTFALWFRARSCCPQTSHRPCVSVETGTCTNPSTECCSAKCSPLASESARAWIKLRRSVRQFQLRPDRQLAASLLSHVWLLRIHILSGRSALRVCHCLACLFADNGASQIKGGAHDVSKQRSSKF